MIVYVLHLKKRDVIAGIIVVVVGWTGYVVCSPTTFRIQEVCNVTWHLDARDILTFVTTAEKK